jgi:hypothetical protein
MERLLIQRKRFLKRRNSLSRKWPPRDQERRRQALIRRFLFLKSVKRRPSSSNLKRQFKRLSKPRLNFSCHKLLKCCRQTHSMSSKSCGNVRIQGPTLAKPVHCPTCYLSKPCVTPKVRSLPNQVIYLQER